MYNFSVWQFSSKEIEQICTLIRNWTAGDLRPIDRRTVSKQVRDYGLHYGLLVSEKGREYFTRNSYTYSVIHDTPIEVLWRMVEPMLLPEGATGYSVVYNKSWQDCNIYPERHRFCTVRDFTEKMEVFNRLQQYGYLIFQHAGSVWCITRWRNAQKHAS
jgi:hypothetical protein